MERDFGYIYINPNTFENSVLVKQGSPSTLGIFHFQAFSKSFSYTETLENAKITLLCMCKPSQKT